MFRAVSGRYEQKGAKRAMETITLVPRDPIDTTSLVHQRTTIVVQEIDGRRGWIGWPVKWNDTNCKPLLFPAFAWEKESA